MKGLIIDDSPIELMMEKALLEKLGFTEVWGAETSEEGFELIQKHQPNLVLCDIDMPDYSGLELLKKSETYLSQIGFVMCSVLSDPEWIVNSIRAGALDYLLKPVKEVKIREILKNISLENKNNFKELIQNIENSNSIKSSTETMLNYQHGICVGLKIAIQSILRHRFGHEFSSKFMQRLSKVEDVEILRMLQEKLELSYSHKEFEHFSDEILN